MVVVNSFSQTLSSKGSRGCSHLSCHLPGAWHSARHIVGTQYTFAEWFNDFSLSSLLFSELTHQPICMRVFGEAVDSTCWEWELLCWIVRFQPCLSCFLAGWPWASYLISLYFSRVWAGDNVPILKIEVVVLLANIQEFFVFFLDQEWVNDGPQIKFITSPVFVNKVLLEHSHTHSLIIYCCFSTTRVEMNSCVKDHLFY